MLGRTGDVFEDQARDLDVEGCGLGDGFCAGEGDGEGVVEDFERVGY